MAAAGAVAVSAAWAWALISRDASWHGWLRYAVLAAAVVAVAFLLARLRTARTGPVVAMAVLVPAPSAAQLDRWIKAGQLRNVLSGSSPEPMMGGGRGAAQARTGPRACSWPGGTNAARPPGHGQGWQHQGCRAETPWAVTHTFLSP